MSRKVYDFTLKKWRNPEQYYAEKQIQKQRSPFHFPEIIKPMPEYTSMASGKRITTRYERKEDLKQYHCRETDPSEHSQSHATACDFSKRT